MNQRLVFSLKDERVIALCQADYQLSWLIHEVGDYSLSLQQDYYDALVRKIIGQQLSIKAAQTICSRVEALCKGFNPNAVNNIPDDDFRTAGVSRSKISYIRNLTNAVLSKEIDFSTLDSLPDDEVISSLTKIKGIGKWTAEMFLIFSLGRLNVLSLADVGLKRAMNWLYKGEHELAHFYDIWNPYNTIASLYLWETVNRGFVDTYSALEDIQE